MKWTGRAIGFVAAVAVAGCGERIVLSDADGWLNLEYDCSSFESVVNSSAERSVVESYAKRIVYAASRQGDMDAIQGLTEAYDDPSPEPLERAVVRHVCSGGEIAATTVVDSARQANQIQGLSRGVQAPDFIAPWLDEALLAGTPDHLRLADLRGGYVLVNFWATWCRPCIEKHPDLVELAEQYAEAGVAVLGILHRDRPARALEWLDQNPPGAYRTVVDESGRIASLFGVRGIPRTFLIDPSGTIIENALYIDPAKTTTLLEELGLGAQGGI